VGQEPPTYLGHPALPCLLQRLAVVGVDELGDELLTRIGVKLRAHCSSFRYASYHCSDSGMACRYHSRLIPCDQQDCVSERVEAAQVLRAACLSGHMKRAGRSGGNLHQPKSIRRDGRPVSHRGQLKPDVMSLEAVPNQGVQSDISTTRTAQSVISSTSSR